MNQIMHTSGPLIVDANAGETPFRVYSVETQGNVGYFHGERDAKLFSASHELLAELKAAHQIIRNALGIMTTAQKNEWARANARDEVDGEGTTRANERVAVIDRATGG